MYPSFWYHESMSNFDASRQSDMRLIDQKLHDKTTTKRGRRLLERSKAAILAQERDTRLRSLRSRLLKATQAGDRRAVMQINEELHRYDRQHGFDQDESR